MVEVGVIGFIVLILIYVVLRAQSLQRELNQFKYSLKSTESKSKFAIKALALVTNELQKSYIARINSANKHGILNARDFELVSFILNNADYVVTQCCENSFTVEEALKKALEKSHFTITDIYHFIATQPTQIKLAWSKNNLGGFVAACQGLSAGPVVVKSAEDSATASE